MDLTNGHLEENPLKIERVSKPKEISVNDLPFKERELIWKVMEMTEETLPPKIYEVEIEVSGLDLKLLSVEELGRMLCTALKRGKYEEVDHLIEEIKSRNYSVDISEKVISLKYEK